MMGKLTHDAGYFRKTLNNIPVLTQIANKMENYESMIFWAENLEKTLVKYSLMLLTEEDTKIN